MEGMKAKLFGAPMILANGQKLELPYKKADALLYYLIYNGTNMNAGSGTAVAGC